MRFVLLLLVWVTATATAQTPQGNWLQLPDPPVVTTFDDGSFVSPDTGWVIFGNIDKQGVHATEDGGLTWEQRGSLPVGPRSVEFATAELGWVGTLFGSTDQHLFETRDGGRTFTNIVNRIEGDPVLGICGIYAVNPSVVYGTGWCCGGGAAVIKTTDGGLSWVSTGLHDLVDFLIDVYFFDEDRGIAIGGSLNGHAAVIGTEDGGETWELRHESENENEWGWKISFPTPDTGYVSIEHINFGTNDGKVLKTTDGGMTWTDIVIPGGGSLGGVGFATGEVGWTSGHGFRSETTDGGLTWTRYEGGLGAFVNRFQFIGDSLGYAFGLRVQKYVAGVPTEIEPALPGPERLTVYPNPATDRVFFAFDSQRGGRVELAVYDLMGRRVAVVAQRAVAAGPQVMRWEGEGGPQALPTGTYLYRLATEDGVVSGPFIWVQR